MPNLKGSRESLLAGLDKSFDGLPKYVCDLSGVLILLKLGIWSSFG